MKSIRILSVGNSFSADTMEHLPDIALSLGIDDFKFANLYIGGCSVNRHYHNIVHGLADYVYFTSTGNGWDRKEQVSIAEALQEEWNIVSIQHGTGDGSRYTSPESYENLPLLIERIRQQAGGAKIAFNMAWVAEPESTHHEITSYGGDQALMYQNLTSLTGSLILPAVDIVSPAGTAVQNARAYLPQKLTRDDFHLSYGLGRYIAALTFLKTLCGIDISGVTWCPDGVTVQEREIAKKAAEAAAKVPFAVSPLHLSCTADE